MKNSSLFDFQNSILSNDLWPNFINTIGLSKAQLAVRQALDLQKMQGSSLTLPVLILETCGSGLVSSQTIKSYTGICCKHQRMLIIYSNKLNAFQLLKDN
tara:strand:- start:622 stop:921 length:300 start_codon:yes stop_codon:yes gene_type:complete